MRKSVIGLGHLGAVHRGIFAELEATRLERS